MRTRTRGRMRDAVLDRDRPTVAPDAFRSGQLSLSDWETIEAIEHEPTDPSGALWPAGTPLLVKLVAWAGWGHFLHFRADDPRC